LDLWTFDLWVQHWWCWQHPLRGGYLRFWSKSTPQTCSHPPRMNPWIPTQTKRCVRSLAKLLTHTHLYKVPSSFHSSVAVFKTIRYWRHCTIYFIRFWIYYALCGVDTTAITISTVMTDDKLSLWPVCCAIPLICSLFSCNRFFFSSQAFDSLEIISSWQNTQWQKVRCLHHLLTWLSSTCECSQNQQSWNRVRVNAVTALRFIVFAALQVQCLSAAYDVPCTAHTCTSIFVVLSCFFCFFV
jgi:hypothetical protein